MGDEQSKWMKALIIFGFFLVGFFASLFANLTSSYHELESNYTNLNNSFYELLSVANTQINKTSAVAEIFVNDFAKDCANLCSPSSWEVTVSNNTPTCNCIEVRTAQ